MKGLLLKDYYTLLKKLRIFLVIIILYAFIPIYRDMIGFVVILCAVIPVTAIAYDEQSHWDSLAAMMPYSVRDLILSKYLIGWICIVGGMLLSTAASLLSCTLSGAKPESGFVFTMYLMLVIGFLVCAVNLPLVFSLGAEKGRIAFYLIIAASTFLGVFLSRSVPEFLSSRSRTFNRPLLGLLAALLALLVNVISIRISMAGYRKRFLT